jgi:hypothetical protein
MIVASSRGVLLSSRAIYAPTSAMRDGESNKAEVTVLPHFDES